MLILSRVCAEFHDASGRKLFSITPPMLLTFQEAPDAIQEDPLFHLLVQDGSLEAVVSLERKHELEQDPIQGADPSGKRKAAAAIAASPDPLETENILRKDASVSQEKPAGRKAGTKSPVTTHSDSQEAAAK